MKRTVSIVALVVVIAAALTFGIVRSGCVRGAGPPKNILAIPVEKIDRDSLELITLSQGEWDDLGQNERMTYKNPNTGEYTMLGVIVCEACGEKIPRPEAPPYPKKRTEETLSEHAAQFSRIKADYRCPRCGERPEASWVPLE